MATIPLIPRPGPSDIAASFQKYIDQVPDGHIVPILEAQLSEREPLAARLVERGDHRYEPGKWTVKQVLGHVSDTERVFQYRALTAARGDTSPLPGFEQDGWVRYGHFEQRTVEDLLEEFAGIRRQTVRLFRRLEGDALSRIGTADGKPFTVRAIPYLLAGHEIHHRKVLEQRYLA